ncbi:AraC family transcriptional regulator [Maribellus maritimus]|uniref:AraC family transcriptional regulator n=1 Tax=Maribellus maritimus TaxID=2870838 RepID=UPI001EEB0745|nr:helix-turn-helix domain-containing protein [Maribellus maritimus]MCG6190882.1 helix-turn-helix domain-containing protein [Maribellus maritimus]
MEYSIAKPSVLLSKFIKHYWAIENCFPGFVQHTQRIVPNGLPELIFYLGDRPVATDTARSINENALLSGHLRGFYDINVSGKLSVFSILFKPQGLRMFLDIPLNKLFNHHVPLRYLFKNDAVEIESKLFEAGSFSERIKIIENYLLKVLGKSIAKYEYKRIDHCINLINQKRGVVHVDFLASEACLSRKQFERTFLYYVGTSPKQFLKTIRFQSSIDKKSRNKSANLTDLTYSCGYYDQSHMINDFQKLTGMTPKQYFNECEPYSDYFQ